MSCQTFIRAYPIPDGRDVGQLRGYFGGLNGYLRHVFVSLSSEECGGAVFKNTRTAAPTPRPAGNTSADPCISFEMGIHPTQADPISWGWRNSRILVALCQGTTLVVPQDQQNQWALAPEGTWPPPSLM